MNDSNSVMGPILITSGLLVFIIGAIIFAGIQSGQIKETPEPPKFQVVDTYNDKCAVVRYTPPSSSKYHYFLDCNK